MLRLKDKTAIVTGAGQGIGFSTAKAFAKEGAMVWALDIQSDKLDHLASHVPNIHKLKLDVTAKDEMEVLAKKIGAVDILFNCAGFVHNGCLLDCRESDLDFSYLLNVKSIFYMTKTFLPGMLEKGRGTIINMASIVSSIKGFQGRFVYGTTKAAVIGLTKSIAADYSPRGVRCNAICPSAVDTPSMRERICACEDPEAAMRSFCERQPIGRMAKSEEIAHLAVYLASDESEAVTGTVVVIDGGASI